MNLIFNIFVGMLGNLLTDFTKKILNWQILSKEPASTDYEDLSGLALRPFNQERGQTIHSALLMLVLCFILLSAATYLPVAFGISPSVEINLAETRLTLLTDLFNISRINVYYFVLFTVAVSCIPIFIFTQLLTKTIAWFIDYNFSNVSKSRFVFFFAGSMLPVTILFATAVTYLNYPEMTLWNCFRHSFLITVILLGFTGIQDRF